MIKIGTIHSYWAADCVSAELLYTLKWKVASRLITAATQIKPSAIGFDWCYMACDVCVWYISGQRDVWHWPGTRAWDQQYGGGEHTAVLYLPETRRPLLHDVSSQHQCCCFNYPITANGCSYIIFFILLLPLTVAVITVMSGSMATALTSQRRWRRPSENGTAWDAEVMIKSSFITAFKTAVLNVTVSISQIIEINETLLHYSPRRQIKTPCWK